MECKLYFSVSSNFFVAPRTCLQRVLASLHPPVHTGAAPSKNGSAWAHALTAPAN